MKRSIYIIIISFILCLSVISNDSSATNYFNWGVETLKVDYGVNGPGAYDVSAMGNTVRDCTVSHSGSCSSRIVVIGNDGQNQQLGWDLIQQNPNYPFNYVGGPSLYYRWWMRIEPGFLWQGTGQKTKSSRAGTASEQPFNYYTGYLNAGSFEIGECDTSGCLQNDGGGTGGGGELNIAYNFRTKNDGQWHEYIVRIKPNTSASCTAGVNCDAEFQAYVDGVSVGTYNNFKLTDLRNPGTVLHDFWGGWMVRPYFQMGDSTNEAGGTIYLDDFSVDDVWNSIYSGGGDTTPPTNVTLTAPAADSTLSGTVTVSGTCTDETSIRGVQFKYGSNNIGSEDTTSPYSVSWDTTAVANGSYSLTAVCTDNGGNSTASSARSVTVSNAIPSNECPSNWKTLHPTWIYCDDFETDKSSLWQDENYYNDRLVRSSGNGLNGSYSLRATFPSSPSSSVSAGDFSVAFGASPVSPTVDANDTTKYRELYWRAYIKNQTGWQPGVGQKLTRATSFHNSSWVQSMVAHWWGFGTPENYLGVDPTSGVCRGGVYPAGSPACTDNTVITTSYNDTSNMYWLGSQSGTVPVLGTTTANTWQCVEGYVKLNDAGQTNGVQTLWVDSVQDATKTGLNFVGTYSTYGINIFRLENYMNTGVSQSEYRDWDNLVLSTTRIGCSISSPDIISSPVNFHIINQ